MLEDRYAQHHIREAHERAARARLAKQAKQATRHWTSPRGPGPVRLAIARLLVRLAIRLAHQRQPHACAARPI